MVTLPLIVAVDPEVRQKLKWGSGEPENLDVEFEQGDWQDLGGGHLVSNSRLVQRWKETGDVAVTMRINVDLRIRNGKITRLYRQAISLSAGLTAGWPNIRICLAGLAAVAGGRGDAETAGVLWGAAESLEKHLAMPLWPDERRRYCRSLEPLPQEPLEAAVAIGRALTLDEAVARALQSS